MIELPPLPDQCGSAIVYNGMGEAEHRNLSDNWHETTAKFSANQMREYAKQAAEQAIERCAVAAWNHYMNTCKKQGIGPAVMPHWCSADAIRALKEQA